MTGDYQDNLRVVKVKRVLARTDFPIVTLCGSTKFKEDFIKAYEELSAAGNIVLSVGRFTHADERDTSLKLKEKFDEMHKAKILMSDFIYVINRDDYIGSSTAKEIQYAQLINTEVRYMYPHKES